MVLGLTLPPETVVIGLVSGLAYGILAVGLLLVYRATRVINFAHGEIGAFGAAALAKLVLDYDWPYFAAFALVVVGGGVIGALVELAVIRRLFRAPRLILLVATIGVAQLLFFAQAALPESFHIAPYPTPFDRVVTAGDLVLRGEHFLVLALVPAIVFALAVFLSRTPQGIAIRAAAGNADAARLASINVKRISTTVWVLAGVLSTLTAILINPIRGAVVGMPAPALGPGLLLRALAAALVGRLVSMPLALAGGIGVGVVEAVLFVNSPTRPGVVDLVLFVVVVVLVLTRGGLRASEGEGASWSLLPRVRAVPQQLRDLRWIERLPRWAALGAFAAAACLPLVVSSPSRLFLFSRVTIFSIVALSVTVLTGWAGQLSLGQFGFVAVGAAGTASLADRGLPFGVALAYATFAGVLLALAVGFPALRIRGLYLAVTTLAFAVAAQNWLLGTPVLLGDQSSMTLPRPELGPIDFRAQGAYYELCLLALAACVFVVVRLRRSGIGRCLIAVRENPQAAAAMSVSPATAQLTAFAIAGGLAALAGGLLGGLRVEVSSGAFGPEQSLQAVAMTIIGGLGSVLGAVLGALYVLGLPVLLGDSEEVRLLTSAAGLLVLLLYLPGGLAAVAFSARDAVLDRLARRRGEDARETPATPAPAHSRARQRTRPPPAGTTAKTVEHALRVHDVGVRFGGRLALDGAHLTAATGEVVGLIGANGAGKSTLMNVVSGFIRPTTGSVELLGRDVSDLAPHDRARAGLARVFQDARLFGDLTVTEAVKVALERRERSEVVPSMLALPPSRRSERRKELDAREVVAFLGLARDADAFVSDLSTGTRRIAELACLLALGNRVLLLDEPTAGLAQRETEAFGPLIRRVQRELGATLVVIEHDIPLVMSISDRVYCLGAGRIIAEGTPDEVRRDPATIAAYLGTDERAIRRSGVAARNGTPDRPTSGVSRRPAARR